MKKQNKKERYVLDSFAILAYFEKTRGWQEVLKLLEKAALEEAFLYMNLVNLGEVYYIFKRERGLKQAEEMLLDVDQLPIEKIEVGWERIKNSASIKADYPISYADAFAVSLAQEFACTIVTGDPEFKRLNKIASVFWI